MNLSHKHIKVWFLNSFYKLRYGVSRLSLETNKSCLGTNLVCSLGQPRVVLWWNFVSPCKPFATTWCCSKAPPSVVPWEVLWQFGVVLGVIICGWVVSHKGGRCCFRVSFSLSFQKYWNDLELCWEWLFVVGLWTMVGLVGIKALDLGSPQFTLNLSFILTSLHLVNKSNPNGYKRFHANLMCHGMCK
jgi:hypothetical protein